MRLEHGCALWRETEMEKAWLLTHLLVAGLDSSKVKHATEGKTITLMKEHVGE